MRDTLASLRKHWANWNRVFRVLSGDKFDVSHESVVEPPARSRGQETFHLHRTEAVLWAIFEAVPVGLVLTDSATRRVLNANPKAHELLGFQFRPGMPWTPTGWEASDSWGRYIEPSNLPLTRLLRTGETTDSEELFLRRPNLSEIWLRVTTLAICLASGERFAALVVEGIDEERRERERAAELSREFTRLLSETYGKSRPGVPPPHVERSE